MAQKTAIIGAGSSGLTVLKALRAADVPAVCFERGSKVGGNWVFDNDNGQSRIYRSLRINTSRNRMQFSDFPMPADYPDYASHEQVARYFDAYADKFDLRPGIRFRTKVERVTPRGRGYAVATDDGQEHVFDAVVVANGHHWDPAFPDPPAPGHFDGITLHSHHYVSPSEPHDLAAKRVVVVGIGNSAVDIASELALRGAEVALSVRRGAWVLPKHAFGRPIDQPGIIPRSWPDSVKTRIAELWYRLKVGAPADYGLPAPDHRLGHAHPTLSDDLLPLLRQGKIAARPAIQRLNGKVVHFTDGSHFDADAVVYCTGYSVSFPFFEPSFVSAPNNELPLFLRCFHLEHRGLMFAGLAQPLGAIMPLVEAQGRLFASYLRGDYSLPDAAEMRERARREREHVRRRFVATRRHTMQVDFDAYLADVARELRAGQRRRG
ncbi:MAG: putative flavoprotein involved in transport [Polyangiaceae bacterium]|jgi:cation diffusion facilitator CzcD-associated flavoprotein CzcO|nr:putative flavoprotein involved in transport [Polyangiaceae bacterium]